MNCRCLGGAAVTIFNSKKNAAASSSVLGKKTLIHGWKKVWKKTLTHGGWIEGESKRETAKGSAQQDKCVNILKHP